MGTTILSIYIAGFVTAFLPCTLPVILGFLGYVSGSSHNVNRREVLLRTILFCLGFSSVFIFFGYITVAVFGFLSTGQIFSSIFKEAILKLGGIFLILIGLVMFRFIKLPSFLNKYRFSFKLPKFIKLDSRYTSFILGVIFASAWSPCIGPILAGILTITTVSTASVLEGVFLLFIFSIGISTPLIIFALFFSSVSDILKHTTKFQKIMSSLAGILFIILGLSFLITDINLLGFLSSFVGQGIVERFL